MKRYIIVCLSILFFSSCSNWLDVQPKTTVEEEEVFSREIGFKEALTGIYIKMASKDLYAKNLSYGFLDILGQRYEPSNVEAYQDELWYTFPSTKTESYTTAIWGKMYNIIANVNNLLYYCDKKRDVFTTENYYEIIKGEALGLRAFLHFDLLRMYGPIYEQNPTSKRIAYRTVFNREPKEMQSSNVVVDSIIADLKQAEIYFGAATGAGDEVNYNKGIVAIKSGDYAAAVNYFGQCNCVNAALANVLAGNNNEALKKLNAENKECPMSYYLKAVIGARTNDATAVIENLRKACSLDGSFKQLAATDMEFAKFFENNDFIAITK